MQSTSNLPDPSILDQRLKALTIQHQEWLQHPVTKELFQVLNKQETKISESIASNAMDMEKSEFVVRLAVQLKTIKTIKQLQYDTTIFANHVTRP